MHRSKNSNVGESWLLLLLPPFATFMNALIISPRQQVVPLGEATNVTRANDTSVPGLQVPQSGSDFLNPTGSIDDLWCNIGRAAISMTASSCQDAIAQIPDTTSALPGPNGAPLYYPYRVSSCNLNNAPDFDRAPNLKIPFGSRWNMYD